MAGKQNLRHVPFYLKKEDVPEVHKDRKNLFKPVEDEKLPLPTAFTGINYQNFSKIDLINAYITLYNRVNTMEQSYSEMTVRNAILQDRLVLNGLSTTMDLDELKQYRVTLEIALQNTLEGLRTQLPQDIKYMVENKVIEEIRKTQIDQGMKLEFQVFEVSRQLKMNLEMQADVMASFEESSKKSASLQKLQQTYVKMIELLSELKQSGKDIDNAFDGVEPKEVENTNDDSFEDENDDFDDLDFDDFKPNK